jgi:type IV secretion system protein TrbL
MPLGILDGIAQTFELATQTWFTTLFPLAQNLFFALMVIQIAWSGIWWTVIRKEGGEQVLVLLLRQVFVLSVLYTVLIFSPIWVPTVIGSFEHAGATAGGIDGINPSSIFSGGFYLALGLLDGLNNWGLLNPITAPMILFTCVVLILCYAWMAGVLLIYLVESYIVLGGGVLLLGFGGSRFTAGLADGYLVYVFKVGVKLFVAYLILGIAGSLAAQWAGLLNAVELTNPAPLFEVLGGALVLALVTTKVPLFASQMLGAHSGFGLRSLFQEAE